MVKMIRDNTGRFAERSFYEARDLDNECERLTRDLLLKHRGKVDHPVSTDGLAVLIEMHGAELDSYANLSAYGADVEGVTEFFPDRGPKVSIPERIAADERRENRFRTTLTHESGYVKFHGPLWAQKFATGNMLERGLTPTRRSPSVTTSWTPRSPLYRNHRLQVRPMPHRRAERCAVCHREPRGWGWFDARFRVSDPRRDTSRRDLCSRVCQDICHRRSGMIDPTPNETAAMVEGGKACGAYLESLDRTDLALLIGASGTFSSR